jgi:hypothetical protein
MTLYELNNYPESFIFNIDETSLLIKQPRKPYLLFEKDGEKPVFHIPKPIFSCTAVFCGFF